VTAIDSSKDLGADDRLARDGRGEQRLERLPLALASRGIDRQLQAADERQQQQQVRQDLLRQVESSLGCGHVTRADLQRIGDCGVNAPGYEPQSTDGAAVTVEQAVQSRYRRAGCQRA
jgi:hypothetical protein